MTPTLQQMTPPPPKEPAFVCIYGPSGVGKTTDCGYSFPTGLFLAAPGALKPLRSVCGYDPASAPVEDIEQATALVRKAAKSGQYDSIIVDDLSFLAEKTFAKTEKKASGFRLWGILRDIVLDFRDACRLEAKCHVIVNCFSRSTEFVTSTGVRSFEDFRHGDEVTVLTHTGAWKRAVVKSYGTRQMNRITIRRGPARHEVVATPDHRWLLANGAETTMLAKGDRLLAAPSIFNDFDFVGATDNEKLAWVRGFHYGDGTTDSRGYANVRLCGRKERFFTRFGDAGFTTRIPDWGNGDVMVNLGKMPKVIPETFATPEEARAYVAGYLAADGHINKSESARGYTPFTGVQTSDPMMSDFIRRYFPTAGVYLVSENHVTRTTNYGTHDATWHTTVEGFSSHPVAAFIVDSIEPAAAEEAWCLEVEDDHSLVLPFGVATGNCWEQVPTQKQDGTKVRGGPLLSGKLPEQLPAMCDKVYRASHDPNRKPWPSIYRCFLDPNYVMKDRDGIVDPAPMNLSEILRDGGYVVRRHPSLEWQEGIVEDLAQAWITLPYEQTIPSANAAYGQLMSAGIHPLHVRWTIRDAMDRTALRRARASKFANFI